MPSQIQITANSQPATSDKKGSNAEENADNDSSVKIGAKQQEEPKDDETQNGPAVNPQMPFPPAGVPMGPMFMHPTMMTYPMQPLHPMQMMQFAQQFMLMNSMMQHQMIPQAGPVIDPKVALKVNEMYTKTMMAAQPNQYPATHAAADKAPVEMAPSIEAEKKSSQATPQTATREELKKHLHRFFDTELSLRKFCEKQHIRESVLIQMRSIITNDDKLKVLT
jgi:hypothetical protein